MLEKERLDRIAFLENEIKKLRAEKENRRYFPENANTTWFYVSEENVRRISHVVRSCCFPDSKIPVKRRARNSRERHEVFPIIRMDEMTDEQYRGYISAVSEILDTLNRCREKHKTID